MWNSLKYLVPIKDGETPSDKSKDKTTSAIYEAFAQMSDQEILFGVIGRSFDRLQFLTKEPELSNSALPYCTTSYIGKYWLNHFMTETKQGVEKKSTGAGYKLPRIADSERVALIFVRTQGPNKDRGRSMTDNNVGVVINAIFSANSSARNENANAPVFSKIIFHRDIEDKAHGECLQKLVDDRNEGKNKKPEAAP